jgi:hypothetical protein
LVAKISPKNKGMYQGTIPLCEIVPQISGKQHFLAAAGMRVSRKAGGAPRKIVFMLVL